MIVYEVAVGDLLVGKKGFEGLLCSSRDDIMCSRALVVGATTAIVLLPAVSFRHIPLHCHMPILRVASAHKYVHRVSGKE